MSVLTVVEAVPSRVNAVLRFLLSCKNCISTRDELYSALSPTSADSRMIQVVVRECVSMGLVNDTGEALELNEQAKSVPLSKSYDRRAFRQAILNAIANREITENHDICALVCWFLKQDPQSGPFGRTSIADLYGTQARGNPLGMNHERWDDFRYWSTYLGLAWDGSTADTWALLPDAADLIEQEFITGPIANPSGCQIAQVADYLTDRYPMLPGGRFSEAIANWDTPRWDPNQVYPSLALSLLRLERSKLIALEHRSDAQTMTIVNGRNRRLISHVVSRGGGN